MLLLGYQAMLELVGEKISRDIHRSLDDAKEKIQLARQACITARRETSLGAQRYGQPLRSRVESQHEVMTCTPFGHLACLLSLSVIMIGFIYIHNASCIRLYGRVTPTTAATSSTVSSRAPMPLTSPANSLPLTWYEPLERRSTS